MATSGETQQKLQKVLSDDFNRQTLTEWIDALIQFEYESFSAKKQQSFADESMRLLVLQAGVEKLNQIKNTINS